MGRLVYHNLSGLTGQSSPFDEAVLEVARTGFVKIVSPYIGVNYLQRIIQTSDGWLLISDIEAWLSSLPVRARPKAWEFIRENLDRIHHCPAIHAKAVISQTLAMFGSANLTNTGILGRTELGMLIDEPPLVAELCVWFDSLWEQTLPPIADEADAFVKWLDDEAARNPARREKLSLSASSKAIRARLSALPTPEKLEPAGQALNLGSVAQGLVIKEQRHYDTLEQALDAAINTLAKGSFSFGEVVLGVRATYANASVREVYFALLQHCANHVRSVFAENTRNRLILNDGIFTQSTRELIPQALAPFDTFLVILIHHYDFSQFRDMPNENNIEAQADIVGGDQVILTSELLDCGFLDIEDIAGHLPRYKLSEDFEWEGRYKLFPKAMHDWIAKKSFSSSKYPIIQNGEDDDDFLDERSIFGRILDDDPLFESDDETKPWNRGASIESLAAKTELARVQQERREKIDKVLSHILTILFSGQQLHPTKQLAEQISTDLGIGRNLAQLIISGKGKGMPSVIVTAKNNISINPRLPWKELKDYPRTKDVCRKFLTFGSTSE